jgi:hypothetical protein
MSLRPIRLQLLDRVQILLHSVGRRNIHDRHPRERRPNDRGGVAHHHSDDNSDG